MAVGLDKGGADLIESGAVKVKQGSAPKAYTATGLSFEDGTELKADAIILAYVLFLANDSLSLSCVVQHRLRAHPRIEQSVTRRRHC